MDRRCFLLTSLTGAVAAPLAVEAQQAGKVWRIGVLVPAEPASPGEPNMAAFRQGLRDLGYVDGQRVTVTYRYAHGEVALFPKLVTELVNLRVDIMVVGTAQAAVEAKKITEIIPIVVVGAADPVGSGLVKSLNRPGGNVTGLSTMFGGGLPTKWVELLKESVPRLTRVGFIRDAGNPLTRQFVPEMQQAAQALGLQFQHLEIHKATELDNVVAAMSKTQGGSLVVIGEALFFPHRSRLPEIAAKYDLPVLYSFRVFVDAGGLMSYGPSLPDVWRRAASYVDKILKGAKPGDLPIEQPTKLELVINLKTAKALGLTIPPSLLLRADQVIE